MKKPNATFSDFLKLDIRAGQIQSADKIEGSNKLLFLRVDLGPDYGVVDILSGIAKHIATEELLNKKVPVVANLEPKPMAGKVSNGFVLMGDLEGHIPQLVFLPETMPVGTVLC